MIFVDKRPNSKGLLRALWNSRSPVDSSAPASKQRKIETFVGGSHQRGAKLRRLSVTKTSMRMMMMSCHSEGRIPGPHWQLMQTVIAWFSSYLHTQHSGTTSNWIAVRDRAWSREAEQRMKIIQLDKLEPPTNVLSPLCSLILVAIYERGQIIIVYCINSIFNSIILIMSSKTFIQSKRVYLNIFTCFAVLCGSASVKSTQGCKGRPLHRQPNKSLKRVKGWLLNIS